MERGGLIATPQTEDGVIYAEKISPAEARIDWSRPAAEVDQHIRGLSPFPGAWAKYDSERIKVLMCGVSDGAGKPGEVLSVDESLIVACGDGAVDLKLLQRSGKRAQTNQEFLHGFSVNASSFFS